MPDWTLATSAEHNARYGAAHRRLRRRAHALVASGNAICGICKNPVLRYHRYDVAHAPGGGPDDYLPELVAHAECNRATATTGERGANGRGRGAEQSADTAPLPRDPAAPLACRESPHHHVYWRAGRLANQSDLPSAMICTPGGSHVARWVAEL